MFLSIFYEDTMTIDSSEYPPIYFPKIMGIQKFEEILHNHFRKSLKNLNVTFDLKDLRFIPTFQLSLLLIWIYQITSRKNRNVTIIAPGYKENSTDYDPTAESIMNYFGSWQVWKAFENLGGKVIASEEQKMKYRQNGKESDFSKHYVPFKFYSSQEEYEVFLKGLETEEGVLQIFEKSASLEVIGTGGLESIILEEIGKNAFEHGRGKAAHIAIGKMPAVHGRTQDEIKSKIEKRIHAVPDYAKSFFRQLGKVSCLEIVISDSGPGIYKTLKRAYLDDKIISSKKEKPSHEDIIQYAFLLHSTSKKESWYVNSLDQDKSLKYEPPRGLFFVKNIAKINRALMICRSNSGTASWDFLSSKDGLFSGQNMEKQYRKRTPLANLGGTQIQILIPIFKEERERIPFNLLPSVYKETEEKSKVVIYSVAEIIQQNDKPKSKGIAQSMVNAVHKAAHKNSRDDIVIFDFLGTHWSKDTLYPVICELGHLSLDGYILGVIHTTHFDAALTEMFVEEEGKNSSLPYVHRFRPFLKLWIQSDSLMINIIGLQQDDAKSNHNEIEMALMEKETLKELPEIIDHIFVLGKDGLIRTKFDIPYIELELKKRQSNLLETIILNPAYNVLRKGKFLLPTSAYIENFFEIGALFTSPDAKQILTECLIKAYLEIHEERTLLCCITKIGEKVGNLLSMHEGLKTEVDQITIREAKKAWSVKIEFNKYKQVVVVVDAIATGKSLSMVLQILLAKCSEINLKILTVLDLRQTGMPKDRFDINDNNFPLVSIFRVPTNTFPNKPHDWSYDEISRIDPVDYRPIVSQKISEELWDADIFVSNTCAESNAIRIGHYNADNGNHYRFFFYSKNIIEKYRDDIVETIRTKIKDINDKRGNGYVSHILYPTGSIGIDHLAEQLAVYFGGAHVRAVERHGNPRTYSNLVNKVDTVVILDTASSSNKTISYLIDVAAEMEAKCIYVCVMMSRSSFRAWRFLSRITGYNNREIIVSCLTRVEIPVFTSETSCPICIRRKHLQRLLHTWRHTKLESIINHELKRIFPKNIATSLIYDDEGSRTSDTNEITRLRLLIEKQRVDPSALTELEQILISTDEKYFKTRKNLLLAYSDETEYLSGEQYGLPEQLHKYLISMSIKLAIQTDDEEVIRTALQLISLSDPDHLYDTVAQITQNHAENIYLIEVTIIEVLLYAQNNPQNDPESILELLRKVHDDLEELAHSCDVHPDILSLVSSVQREFHYNLFTNKAKQDDIADNFIQLLDTCQRKRGGTHPYISHSFMNISMLSDPNAFKSVQDDCYYADAGFREIVLNEVLPRIAAMTGIFKVIDNDDFIYLIKNTSPSLKNDLYILDNSFDRLRTVSQIRRLTHEDLEKYFYNKTAREARKRLGKWLAKEGKMLISLLERCICDITTNIESCCSRWHSLFKKKNITLEFQKPSKTISALVWPFSLQSITDTLLENCYYYAFDNIKCNNKIVRITAIESNTTVSVTVADNGVGLDNKSLLGRLKEISQPFGGDAQIEQMPEFSTCISTSWKIIRR